MQEQGNSTFIQGMLGERAVEVKRDMYVCFLEYTKTVCKVRYEENIRDVAEPRYRCEGHPTNLELILGANCCN